MMKMYVVECLDTNDVISVLGNFNNRYEAEQYVDKYEKINRALQFSIREKNGEHPIYELERKIG